jgi:glycosyltransferase involved in cell wall biosynthesis
MNKKQPLVSVIVPVYKVEAFLPKCLQSIEKQSYHNLEIILVDDGSPDGCGKMCDEFAIGKNNVLVVHQDNQGLSAARNYGVSISKGEYIVFVDSDDFVSDNHIEYLLYLILKYDADVSIGKYIPVYYPSTKPIKQSRKSVEILMTKEESMQEACYGIKFGMSAWSKMYKRNLVEKYPYPVGKLYEELATTYKILSEANRVVYGSMGVYYYVQRADSIMHKEIGKRELYGLVAAKDLLVFMTNNYPSIIHAARVRLLIKVQQYMPALFATNRDKKTFYLLKNEIRPYFKEVINDRYIGINLRIKLITIMCGFYPSLLLFNVIRKLRFGR